MKVIIAGSRNITDIDLVVKIINEGLLSICNSEGLSMKKVEIVAGGAKGVDTIAEQFAIHNKIKYKIFPANWNLHGKKAGYLRNKEMAEYSDALIAIWDGVSKGTKHMMDLANKYELKTELYKPIC